jgi:signal transduction histidine kinase
VTCTADGDFESIDSNTSYCLYRIAQEALHNVVKHAQARQVDVRLVCVGDRAELTIADDGKGFDAQTRRSGTGLGLVSITERARLAGGTVSIVTALGKGTKVQTHLSISARTSTRTGDLSGQFASST